MLPLPLTAILRCLCSFYGLLLPLVLFYCVFLFELVVSLVQQFFKSAVSLVLIYQARFRFPASTSRSHKFLFLFFHLAVHFFDFALRLSLCSHPVRLASHLATCFVSATYDLCLVASDPGGSCIIPSRRGLINADTGWAGCRREITIP